MRFKIIIPIIIALLSVDTLNAQWRRTSDKTHEIGFVVGSSRFTTDYGQRYNFEAGIGGNAGIGIGIIHYLTFTDYRYRWNQQTNFWQEHFRIRNELTFASAKLEHFGEWVERPGEFGDRLRAHTGKANVWNLGSQLEYHIIDINDFGSRRDPDLKYSPYITGGFLISFYNPTIETSYGNGNWKNDYSLLFPKWASSSAAKDSKGTTLSATFGFGLRRKFKEYSDIFIETRWQYFFSDWVDGLNATPTTSPDPNPNNKFNDWNLFIQFGYVYYLD